MAYCASPTVSVTAARASEADGEAVFTVSITPPADAAARTTANEVRLDYATHRCCHAGEGVDYMTTWGTLTIPAGARYATVSVPLIDDAITEGTETFTLSLSTPVGASLATATAQGHIQDAPSTAAPSTACDGRHSQRRRRRAVRRRTTRLQPVASRVRRRKPHLRRRLCIRGGLPHSPQSHRRPYGQYRSEPILHHRNRRYTDDYFSVDRGRVAVRPRRRRPPSSPATAAPPMCCGYPTPQSVGITRCVPGSMPTVTATSTVASHM